MGANDYRRTPATQSEPPSLERLRSRIRRQAAEIERREVDRAVCRLDAVGDLSDADQEVVEAMADRIVARVLGLPTAALDETEQPPDPAELTTLARLFDPSTEQNGEE